MDRFFAVLGKVLLGVILLIGVLGAGYYIGTTKNKVTMPPSSSPLPSVAQISTAETKPLETPIPTDTPAPTKTPTKTVKGGLDSGTSFKKYSLEIPADWTEKDESTPGVIDKKTFSKNGYSLSIYQAAIGGGGCLYPGDADQMMAQKFTDYTQINDYRRSWNSSNTSPISFTICQKGPDGSYGSPTKYGAISGTAPVPSDDLMLKQLDEIIASITVQ